MPIAFILGKRAPRRRARRERAGIAAGTAALVGLALALALTLERAPPEPTTLPRIDGMPLVRVALAKDEAAVTVAVHGPYEIYAGDVGPEAAQGAAQAPSFQGERLPEVRAKVDGGSLVLGTARFPGGVVRVRPRASGTLQVGELRYHGDLLLTAGPGGLLALNRVPLEPYVAGVLGAEMPLYFPEAALRAQAVAARTYALFHTLIHKKDRYDVLADTRSQVYRGTERETDLARRVVRDTLGVVLAFEGKVLQAYFHSTCGGGTISAAWVFGEREKTPLAGAECGYCDDTKYARWELSVPLDELAKTLAPRGVVAPIAEVAVTAFGPKEHVEQATVRHAGGTLALKAVELRAAIGYAKMRSTRFSVAVRPAERLLHVVGRGFGHGVGMCQMGAKGMADKGFSTESILLRYYPGVVLAKLYDGSPLRR